MNTLGLDSYSLPWTISVRDKVDQAFIKTTDGDKLFLLVGRDKDLVLKTLGELNKTLKTQIFDTSN